jgi:hypothetical protein
VHVPLMFLSVWHEQNIKFRVLEEGGCHVKSQMYGILCDKATVFRDMINRTPVK